MKPQDLATALRNIADGNIPGHKAMMWIEDHIGEIEAALSPPAVDKASEALALFRSVIKSGEPWTDACQQAYEAALAALRGQEGG